MTHRRKENGNFPEWRRDGNVVTGLSSALNDGVPAEEIERYRFLLAMAKAALEEERNQKRDYTKEGAVPKACNSKENITPLHPQIVIPQNPYKWYKSQKWDNKKYRKNSITSTSSLDSTNPKPFHSFPFYYIVPENPALDNMLPPGKYLVIPQHKISNKPLRVLNAKAIRPKKFYKPQDDGDDKDQAGGTPTNSNMKLEEKKNSGNVAKRNESVEKGKKKSATQTDGSNPTPKACCNNEIAESSVKSADESFEDKRSSSQSNEEFLQDSGDIFPDSLLASLLEKLPYYGENILKMEWSRKETGDTFDLFVKKMRSMRANEVSYMMMERLPLLDPDYLLRKASEVVDSNEDIESFVEKERIIMREKVMEALTDEFDEEDIIQIMDRFSDSFEPGEEERAVTFLKNELMVSKAEQKKIEKLQMIFAVLPDVDPVFILSELENLTGDTTDLDRLVERLLESGGYPKAIEFDPENREKRKLWAYYVTNFSVTNYLKKVPDPEEFFSGSSVRDHGIKIDDALEFLGKRYPDLDNFQLTAAFNSTDQSITKTCVLLDRNYLPELSAYKELERKQISEAFLQEITFIGHKDEIIKHLEKEKRLKEMERRRAELENAFLECVSCYDTKVIISEAVFCSEGHIACRHCVITYIETSFGDGKTLFPCLSGSCELEYRLETVKQFLDPKLFLKISQKRAADDVDRAAVPGLEKCPSCDFAYVPAPEDKIFTCLNEDCMRQSCRLCKELNHIPLSCNEVERPKDLLARQQVEEAMTEKLIRSCPNCKKKFIKTDGCNKIACPCGTLCCYICLQVVRDYSHFNGLGGTELHKCPLYSDNRKIHVQDVVAAGVEMRERLLRENPDIHIVHDPIKDKEAEL